ncbi:MAG: hypothetical protein ABI658_22870 [Acidimicrobiales bacterium]
MSRRRWALTLLLAVIALSIQLPTASAASVATVVTMNGPAEIEKSGATVVGVTTGADTTVIVQIDGTHDVTIYQNTELRIGDTLALRTGTIRVHGSLTVSTSTALSGVSGAEMTVAYDDQSGITTIEVSDRDASVRGSNDSTTRLVPAGQMVRVGTDGLSSTPQAISPDEIIAARIVAADEPTARERAVPYLIAIAAAACLLVAVGRLPGSRRVRPSPLAA